MCVFQYWFPYDKILIIFFNGTFVGIWFIQDSAQIEVASSSHFTLIPWGHFATSTELFCSIISYDDDDLHSPSGAFPSHYMLSRHQHCRQLVLSTLYCFFKPLQVSSPQCPRYVSLNTHNSFTPSMFIPYEYFSFQAPFVNFLRRDTRWRWACDLAERRRWKNYPSWISTQCIKKLVSAQP